MDEQRLEGPRLNSLSGNTRQLVIILHGYGADGADLISLGRQWQKMLPDAEFVAPNAPQFCQNPPMGYQWFPLKVTEAGCRINAARALARGAGHGTKHWRMALSMLSSKEPGWICHQNWRLSGFRKGQ